MMSAAQHERTKDSGISLNNWIILAHFLKQIKVFDSKKKKKLFDSEAPLFHFHRDYCSHIKQNAIGR